jgi:hypothetical protein
MTCRYFDDRNKKRRSAIAKLLLGGFNEDRAFGTVMFPALALTVTFTQWVVLRRHFARSGWWFAASIAGGLPAIASAVTLGRLLTSRLRIGIQPSFATRTLLGAYGGAPWGWRSGPTCAGGWHRRPPGSRPAHWAGLCHPLP